MKPSGTVFAEPRPLEALLAVALQLRARMDAKDGIKRNLGSEAVFLKGFGFSSQAIAQMIGSTPGSVAEFVRLAQKGENNGKSKNK